jgi:capsular polysaccharide biosynthesis protein
MIRRGWIVLAAAFLAAAGACLFTALQPPTYRGHVELVVTRGNEPLDLRSQRERAVATSLRELVQTHVLAANVVDALKLNESPETLLARVSVSTPQAAVLRIAVADPHRDQALRIASEVGLVFTQLVQARFGAGVRSRCGSRSGTPLTPNGLVRHRGSRRAVCSRRSPAA